MLKTIHDGAVVLIRIAVAVGAILWGSAAISQTAPGLVPEFIGMASMSSDGTVTLHLTRTADGQFADATFTYGTDDPKYREILAHVGGLKPGETKPVKPWPDP
jgi:hypothetical protein